MPKTVKFNISLSVDGKNAVEVTTREVRHLAEELGIANKKGDEALSNLLRFNNVTQAFQNVFAGLQQITGLMQQYTAANAIQQEAETKLANNMRNTMNARDEDIQSIKDLCSAQQQLGVIGDEVQLAGAQELATYLEKKSSLEKLIPVMNDMVAQQYGLNATQESAANIATMLGKVMEGQTGALSRYGYKFDAAQEQILKFGTEEERAAVLAEVVESAVGGMNAELAKTDAGKAKQAANDMGDFDEKVGALFSHIEPLILKVGQLSHAINALSTTAGGIVAVTKAIRQLYFTTQLTTKGAIAMRAAIVGLMAVTGVGLAIAAVSGIISLFSSNTDKAAESMDEATRAAREAETQARRQKEVENAAADAYTNTSAALNIYKTKLKDLIDQKSTGKDVTDEEKKIVGELNDTYGQTMGYFSSVSQWYNALIANSEDYCRQMVLEAKTRKLANQIAEMESDRHDLIYDENGNKRKYKPTIGRNNVVDYIFGSVSATDEGAIAQSKVDALDKGIENAQRQMDEAVKEASGLQFSVHGSNTRSDGGTGGKTGHGKQGHESKKELSLIENPATYKELANNVSYYQQQLEKANIADTENIMALARKKTAAESAAQAFKTMTEAAAVPGDLKSIDDYEKKLSYLRTSRNVANRDNIAAIDAEIERTEAAKAALEDESIAALKDDEIQTYEQLNRKLQYFNRLVQEGDEQQRISAQNNINRLNKLQEKWDNVLESAKLPATTDTIRDIDATISFYTARQQREDADQIQKTQAIIDGLERKKRALQLGIEIPSMQREIADIQELTGRERRVKIKGMGFDELTAKIKELNKLLHGTG